MVRPRVEERKDAWVAESFKAGIEIVVYRDARILVVIEARASQTCIVEFEAQRANQVQSDARIGA